MNSSNSALTCKDKDFKEQMSSINLFCEECHSKLRFCLLKSTECMFVCSNSMVFRFI